MAAPEQVFDRFLPLCVSSLKGLVDDDLACSDLNTEAFGIDASNDVMRRVARALIVFGASGRCGWPRFSGGEAREACPKPDRSRKHVRFNTPAIWGTVEVFESLNTRLLHAERIGTAFAS
ncbi:hypothetical protein AJ87_21585 [Rhizobium yanglingense]|nr:hypothetical protein AJ87_21585 [Rhizobium yanglingense]